MKKIEICLCLIAWIVCLDEFEKFASQFYLIEFCDLVNFSVSY